MSHGINEDYYSYCGPGLIVAQKQTIVLILDKHGKFQWFANFRIWNNRKIYKEDLKHILEDIEAYKNHF
jgi:hypothetical protein